MDRNGNMFFVLNSPLALACWDSSTTYGRHNIKIVYRNDEILQFASGMKVKRNPQGEDELWIMTDKFQKIMRGSISPNEVNYRILRKTTRELLRNEGRCNGEAL